MEALLSKLIDFKGSSLIGPDDLKSLTNVDALQSQDKWLSNFIEDYMNLIQSFSDIKGRAVSWEKFEKSTSHAVAKHLQDGEMSALSTCDLKIIPCNKPHIEHWCLLVVLPKSKIAAVLDSKAEGFLKPSAQNVMDKIGAVLEELDFNVGDWTFACNTKEELPQQTNDFDCGVYICLYSRCLTGLGPMIKESCFPEFKLGMAYSLHRRILQKIPEPNITADQFYAVDYLTNYYIGRAMSVENQMVTFRYLHRVGAFKFDFPRRADIDTKPISSVFFGPLTIESTGSFSVPMQKDIEKIFKSIK